ncbi:Helicase associated domain (plasmid) [Tsukamurella tyrosinosolvens]|uniref:Helicase associated domain-containing protein n=1 Tax=Tsukamurella tyrosinosolvens TaxID=57704 RepID=A0A1H4UC22_TSUTY|nr:helicase associated domain-containing protein [Tsukamurella tyrosinosolvens]KXO92980.1 hypothetical protein AXK58_14010 [Tsukamurella tyrosinosolvens]SEC65774.1 Helicase associated domain-containing protein [Tsukamurella tyrosinosolvens]VEH94095.1 Helicase associated domain [Tsukamurella tyrosinosolvens]
MNAWDARWEAAYAQLQAFADEHGSCDVPQDFRHEGGVQIYYWIRTQQQRHRAGVLSPARSARLESLPGWKWAAAREDPAEQNMQALLAYVDEYGTADVPTGHVTASGIRLGHWVAAQRQSYRRAAMSAERAAALTKLPGWRWSRSPQKIWEKGYRALLAYAREHDGSCFDLRTSHVTDSGIKLGHWVHNQRQFYRRGQMTRERAKTLEAVPGWTWSIGGAELARRRSATGGGRRAQLHFDRGIELLARVSAETGTAAIRPSVVVDGVALGLWVQRQRAEKRRGRLSSTAQARLEAVPGWTWTPQEDRWRARLDRLRQQAVRNGGGAVSTAHVEPDGLRLGAWIVQQRIAYRNGTLSPERIRALEAVPGWEWVGSRTRGRVRIETQIQAWVRRVAIAHLRRFYRAQGHFDVPFDYAALDEFPLGAWVAEQRRAYVAGRLPQESREALSSLHGWTWSEPASDTETGAAA